MKTITLLALVTLTVSVAKAQKLDGDSTFVTVDNKTISVSDSLKIGLPVAGQPKFLFIEDANDKKIKKVSKVADNASAVGSVVGLGGGLKGAMRGIKIGRAASKVSTAAGAADIINGHGIIKPGDMIVITSFYTDKNNEVIAAAKGMDNHKYLIKINQAMIVKEVVTKDADLFQEEEDGAENQ
jgi:hypothetical protein